MQLFPVRKDDARSESTTTRARETRVWHPVIMRSGESISGVNPTGARARTAVDVIAMERGRIQKKLIRSD